MPEVGPSCPLTDSTVAFDILSFLLLLSYIHPAHGCTLYCSPRSLEYDSIGKWYDDSRNKCDSKAIGGGEGGSFGSTKLSISSDHISIK